MTLPSGTRLGSYEILGALGAGGMGEVYRAHDTRLGRDVAIKVLPSVVASDPDRLDRFEREARVLAALNHQNIAQIHGVVDLPAVDGLETGHALVMELVDGETLAERIAHAPTPVDDTIAIARQIADALEAAHDAGIVHRDLKPANIKVRPDGVVKVLDFGLAKALDLPSARSDIGSAPTFTSPAVTAVGMIVGTAAYMAPEQAKGKAADARVDLWAFGTILYEMLTGRPLFEGSTLSEVLAAVLRDDPKWDALPADTPVSVRRLLRRCLQKDPQLRLRHAADARLELLDPEGREHPGVAATSATSRRVLLWVIPAALVVAGIAFFAGTKLNQATELPLRKWLVLLDAGDADAIWFGENVPAISPDGSRLAYVDGNLLRIRTFATLEDRDVTVPGVPGRPAWSPDASSVAYFVDHRSLWRVPAAEGQPAKICDLPQGVVLGIAWRQDKTILVNLAYGPGGAEIFSVADTGGAPQRRPVPGAPQEKSSIVFDLRALPDGSLTYTHFRDSKLSTVLERESAAPKVLNLPANNGLAYSPSGHLVFTRRDAPGIFAARFDLASASVTGEPFRIVENGLGPTVSADGTLAYLRPSPGVRQLTWFDRRGMMGATIGQPQDSMWSPAISPDGRRVAVAGVEQGTPNIWAHETGRSAKSRLTFGEVAVDPAWHPVEARIAFQTGRWDISVVSADGGNPQTVITSQDPEYNAHWSHDGKYLIFGRYRQTTGGDIWILERGAKEPRPFLETRFNEGDVTLSPDGKYVAYASDETGRVETFVRTFPGGEGKKQLTFSGGSFPKWSPKGDEIFVVEGQRLMAVRVRTSPEFAADPPTFLFDLEPRGATLRIYDTLDGQRFAVVRTVRPPRNGAVITQNWAKEFAGR